MSALLRFADLTGVSPGVLFSLNGRRLHTTKVGGICSIFAFLMVFVVGVVMLYPLFGQTPPFTQTYSFSTLPAINNTVVYDIQSDQSVFASRIVAFSLLGNFNISQYVIPVYTYQVINYTTPKVEVTNGAYPAVPCLEKFAGAPA